MAGARLSSHQLATARGPLDYTLARSARKTIGLRVPHHAALQALLAEHNGSLLSATLILPGEAHPLYDANEIEQALGHQLAGIIDAGPCPHMPTTVVDLTTMQDGGPPTLLRQGAGDPTLLGL